MIRRHKVVGLLSLAVILSGAVLLYYHASSNFHAVTEGEAYRSAQMDGAELEERIREYGIKSILNLRGEHPDEEWYAEEREVSEKLRIEHYDVGLSAMREPAEEEVRRLLAIFRDAPRPILIHCMSGADRTGLVSAMWKAVVDGEPKTEAEKQLSIRFGHVPVGRTSAMDRFFRDWDPEAGKDAKR